MINQFDPPNEPSPLGEDEGDSVPSAFPICRACNTNDYPPSAMQAAFCIECVNAMLHGLTDRFAAAQRAMREPPAEPMPQDDEDDNFGGWRNPMQIPLTRGAFALVDASDYPALAQHRWYCSTSGYATRVDNDKRIYMHRVVAGAANHEQVDHRDGDRLNNTRGNLRTCSRADNLRNRGPNRQPGSSKYKGVYYHKPTGKWRAAIKLDGQRRYLGAFSLEIDAARAYDRAALELHGEFAQPNLPNEIDRGGWRRPLAVTRQSALIEARLTTCGYCQGIHHVQSCPELHDHLRASDADWRIALGRELCRMEWRDFKAFVALLLSVPTDQLLTYAASYQIFIRSYRPDSTLAVAEVLAVWARDMQRGQSARALGEAA